VSLRKGKSAVPTDREVRLAARLAARPAIAYDEALPVNVRRAEIAKAIEQYQVVVICGETGSGKTTQLPKICLELGRGCAGLIGHTQPRRIAARATASRIAQELKSEPGRYVGFKIRFTDNVSPDAYIKLMTDGILLAETQRDPAAARLRHDPDRRGARTQPEHRLPARPPEADPAAAA
jgi:ATP-dependent helicase HrpA